MVCVSVKMCAEEETCSITYENGFQKWKEMYDTIRPKRE